MNLVFIGHSTVLLQVLFVLALALYVSWRWHNDGDGGGCA